jgi:hypothetical protein
VGTVFYYALQEEDDVCVPVLVTNKHVVKGTIESTFRVSLKRERAQELGIEHVDITIPTRGSWYGHPDPNVDLCVCTFADLITNLPVPSDALLWTRIQDRLLPSNEDLESLSSVEDVVMVGYPVGPWDSVNNKPIFRKGITATHPNLPYNGKREFLIDIAAFPGSSGSPVFVYREGFRVNNSNGQQVTGKKGYFFFIGILYAGPMYNAQGQIEVRPVPTKQEALIYSQVPTNLGIVLSATCMRDFEKMVAPK